MSSKPGAKTPTGTRPKMLLDNKSHGKVVDELRAALSPDSKMLVLTAWFSVFGYSALKSELGKVQDLRILLTRPDAALPLPLAGTTEEIGLKNELNLQRIAAECADWVRKKAQVRQLAGAPIAQNIFHVQPPAGEAVAVAGTSDFTAAGLGVVRSDSFAMNTVAKDPEATKQLLNWFETIWNDPTAVRNAKDAVLESLDFLASDKPANLLYFITLFNIFRDFIEEIDEESIIRSKTGFKDTLVWNKLYKFQKDGVLGAIDKLERYNGGIIADSVGLGKTFEALAVIKYYELRNDRVLVLTPMSTAE